MPKRPPQPQTIVGQDVGDFHEEGGRWVLINCQAKRLSFLNASFLVRGCWSRNVERNFLIADKCHSSLVDWCDVDNSGGKPAEDYVNFFQSADCHASNLRIIGPTTDS